MTRPTSDLLTVFLSAFFLWAVIDAKVEESMEVRVFNPEFRASDSNMERTLEKAKLEEYGYKKEIVTKLVKEPDSDKTSFQKMYHLYKTVDCSQMNEVYQELETLIPGIFDVDVVTRMKKEITSKGLDAMRQCKAGLEVHFKEDGNCTKQARKRRNKRAPCIFCFGCSWARVVA